MAVTVLNLPSSLPGGYQIVPVAVPTVAEDVVSESVYLEYAQFSNPAASTITVTIADKQGTPLEVFRVEVSGNAPVSWEPKRRYCPGGINWVASASGVVGYLQWSK